MAQSFTIRLNVGGHYIENVHLHWGLRAGEARQGVPSYGTDIEIPAVIELLDLIASGKITAERARKNLDHAATVIKERMDREFDEMIEAMEKPSPRSAPKRERFDNRWVYAISTDENPDLIKIGFAANIPQRVKTFQAGSPNRLHIRWSSRGGHPLERNLHDRFQERRTHGEWFNFQGVPNPAGKIDAAARKFLIRYIDTRRTNSA